MGDNPRRFQDHTLKTVGGSQEFANGQTDRWTDSLRLNIIRLFGRINKYKCISLPCDDQIPVQTTYTT